MRGMIHHIDLTVRDPKASFGFYDAVLGALGYRSEGAFEGDSGYDWGHVEDRRLSIGLVRANGANAGRARDRYAPGLHHVAWSVESRAAVDEMYRRLQEMGATILDPPAEYPQYNRGLGYYAVFFADPDGLKLEIVYTAPRD